MVVPRPKGSKNKKAESPSLEPVKVKTKKSRGGRPKTSARSNKSIDNLLDTITCNVCKKSLINSAFYNTNSNLIPKYPVCKSCLKAEIKPGNIQSLYRVLKDMDIGFVKAVWDNSCEKYPDSVFANYMRMMNSLPQYKGTKWSNSKFGGTDSNDGYNGDGLIYSSEWMGNYTPDDLKYLEGYLSSLKKDFKIVTTNHVDYAKKVAKASLAMDRAYEDMLNGGSDSKYKMMKEIFDTMSRSAQFAESERGINDVSLGCFGVVFDKVEKHMYVPEHVPTNKDMYDNLLDQFANINKSL